MSLKSLPIPPVPEETARVAHAAFPRGNVAMQVRDTLGAIYTDEAFAATTPTSEQIERRMSEGPVWLALLDGAVVGTISAAPRKLFTEFTARLIEFPIAASRVKHLPAAAPPSPRSLRSGRWPR